MGTGWIKNNQTYLKSIRMWPRSEPCRQAAASPVAPGTALLGPNTMVVSVPSKVYCLWDIFFFLCGRVGTEEVFWNAEILPLKKTKCQACWLEGCFSCPVIFVHILKEQSLLIVCQCLFCRLESNIIVCLMLSWPIKLLPLEKFSG